MRFSTVFVLGFAAFALASPVPEADAEAGVALSERSVEAPAKIMSSVEPVDLVTRQANTTAAAAAPAAKKVRSSSALSTPLELIRGIPNN